MRKRGLLALACALVAACGGRSPDSSAGQPGGAAIAVAPEAVALDSADPFAGVWRGTSTCTPGHPACHDETVVYRVMRRAAQGDYTLDASKIVRGAEEDMGPLECVGRGTVLECPMPPQYAPGVWHFELEDGRLRGTLTMEGEGMFRRIDVVRDAP